jgi:hypothetical protein
MRPALVVVGCIGPQHPLEVPAAEHENPVQTLCPDGADPPLGERVRARSPDRRLDDPRAFGAEDLVERTGELRVPIPDEEPNAIKPLPQRQVAGLLDDPRRVRVPANAEDIDPTGAELDREQDVQRPEPDRRPA